MTDFKFQCLDSKIDESGKLTSRFILRSLKYGQGITLANTLRRVLLSEINGTAISAVKIPGMVHEFSTIPGVREDLLEIFLNLKQIIIKRRLEAESYGKINIKGPGIITASQIECINPISIINPNQYIATVTNPINFTMDLQIRTSTGYSLGEQTKQKHSDFLALDAVYMPVLNVNYTINSEYQGQATNTEYLVLEITTNGSITPLEALNEAANCIAEWFNNIATTPILKIEEVNITSDFKKETILIEELQLPVRAYNCLKRVGINSIDDLLEYTQEDIRNIKNFGKKSAQDVLTALKEKFNITLATINTAKI